MYIGYGRLCVCLSVAAFSHYCTDPDVTWRNGRGADLQSVHGFRCYDNIAPNAKFQRVLILAVCLVKSCKRALKIAHRYYTLSQKRARFD